MSNVHAKLIESEIAATKLLAFAIQRNVQAVQRRYPKHARLAVFQQITALTDTLIENASRGQEINIMVYWQPSLPDFESDDNAYGDLD